MLRIRRLGHALRPRTRGGECGGPRRAALWTSDKHSLSLSLTVTDRRRPGAPKPAGEDQGGPQEAKDGTSEDIGAGSARSPSPPSLPPSAPFLRTFFLPFLFFHRMGASALHQALRPTEQKCSFAIKKRPGRKDAKPGPQAMLLGRKRASREAEAPGGRASPGPGRCLRKHRRC